MGINTVRLYICHHQIVGTGSDCNWGRWWRYCKENKSWWWTGGDVNGDEDDYFYDFDDGDEGDGGGLFRRQKFLEELFGHKFVDEVSNEWQGTMMDLPVGFQKAYDMWRWSIEKLQRDFLWSGIDKMYFYTLLKV